jgi:hypothetical protein
MWQMEATRSLGNNTATATRIINHLTFKSEAHADVATQDALNAPVANGSNKVGRK